jgi:hypothetical protein
MNVTNFLKKKKPPFIALFHLKYSFCLPFETAASPPPPSPKVRSCTIQLELHSYTALLSVCARMRLDSCYFLIKVAVGRIIRESAL